MIVWKKLGECCILEKGITPIQKAIPGEYPLVVTSIARKTCNTYQFEKPSVCVPLVSSRGHGVACLNQVFFQDGKFALGNILCAVTPKEDDLNARFLYYYLNTFKDSKIVPLMTGGANVSLTVKKLSTVRICYPSKAEQTRIVGILDTFTDAITNLKEQIKERRKQYEYYRDQLLDLEGKEGVEMKTLPEISKNLDKQRKPITSSKRKKGIYPYYGASGIVDYVEGYIFDGTYLLISEDGANLLARTTPIAFQIRGRNWVNNHAHVLSFENEITLKYVEIYLNKIDLTPWINGAAQPKLNQDNLNRITIPFPSLQEQSRIVSILDQFESSIANLEAQLKEREKQYEHYRNQLLTFE